jgi:outer membrane lipoprotein carrier protein
MLKKTIGILFAGVCFIASQAHAGPGLDQLRKFTSNLRSMQADFTQTLFDDKMREIEVSTGRFSLEKPGKFRWDYLKPYQQHIVADGQKLWLYDPELDQVTVKSLSEALGAAPIALLTSNENLEEQFKIIELGQIDGREYLQLEVKVKDTDYGLMLLALGKSGLEAMELKDKLGQVTRIEFQKVTMNGKIDSEQFKFVVPKGVDVIGE